MWLSGQSVTAHSGREGERFNSAIYSNSKEIIDMVGTQNEKIKAI